MREEEEEQPVSRIHPNIPSPASTSTCISMTETWTRAGILGRVVQISVEYPAHHVIQRLMSPLSSQNQEENQEQEREEGEARKQGGVCTCILDRDIPLGFAIHQLDNLLQDLVSPSTL